MLKYVCPDLVIEQGKTWLLWSGNYTVCHPLSREVLFCFGYELPVTNKGCTVAAVSAHRPVEHVKISRLSG